MLRRTTEQSGVKPQEPYVVTTCWRLVKWIEPRRGDHAEARRSYTAVMTSLLTHVAHCAGVVLENTLTVVPSHNHGRLRLDVLVTHDGGDPATGEALIQQVEQALSQQFKVERQQPRHARKFRRPSRCYEVNVVSTVDAAGLWPLDGQYSDGQPLEIHSPVDWPVFLRHIADLDEPVSVSIKAEPIDRGAMDRGLDDARRRWELSDRRRRRDERASDRWSRHNGSGEDAHKFSPPSPTTAARQWPTRTLAAVASTVAAGAIQLTTTVRAKHKATAHAVAGILLVAAFEPGTARIVAGSSATVPPPNSQGGKGATTTDLQVLTRSLCGTETAARLFAGPWFNQSSPWLLPIAAEGSASSNQTFLELGRQYDECADKITDLPLKLPLKNMLQHVGISGMSGKGKSVALIQIISAVARRDRFVPTLVISLARDECSGLARLDSNTDPKIAAYGKRFRVYGLLPGAPRPARITPFDLKNASAPERADHVARVIRSAIETPGPLAGNLLEAVQDLCEEQEHHAGMTPIVSDIAPAVVIVQRENGYTNVTNKDLGGAFKSRSTELTSGVNGEIFRATASIPSIKDVMKDPMYIALGRVGIEIAAMFVVNLLGCLERHLIRMSGPDTDTGEEPRLLIIIDEIQELCPRVTGRVGEKPDIAAEATRLCVRAVKTFRGYGVGLIFATQNPSAVDEQLFKSVGTHVAFGQNSGEDREELRGLMALSDIQYAELNRLPIGQAYYRGADSPHVARVVVPFEKGLHDLKPLSDDALAMRCAVCRDARQESIHSYGDEMTLREDRLERATTALCREERQVLRLKRAGILLDESGSRETRGSGLRHRIATEVEAILHDVTNRQRSLNRDWRQTLSPPRAWLTDWAQTAKTHMKQRRAVNDLQRRHALQRSAYDSLIARHARLIENLYDLLW